MTGYAVALPCDDGAQIWFGGGKLAPDLTLPKLQARWAAGGRRVDPRLHGPGRDKRGRELTEFERARVMKYAELAARKAADHIAACAMTDPASAADAAWAAADFLHMTARLVEGRRVGPFSQAADGFERAALEVHRRTPAPTDAGHGLRNASHMLSALRSVAPRETRQLIEVMIQCLRLIETVIVLRETQARAAQAAAARSAAEQMRRALAERKAAAAAAVAPLIVVNAHRPTTHVAPAHRGLRR